jgi:hypothetical protein
MQYIETIHAEEFLDFEALDVISRVGRYTITKGQIASKRFGEIYRGSSGKRKKTTKAEAVAQHIDALVKLLQEEPDTVVEPILDFLLERVAKKLGEAGHGY